MRFAALLVLVVAPLVGCTASSDVSRDVGARCDSSGECTDRCLPEGAGYPGGFCTLVCNRTSECPSDTACVDREGGSCLFTCADDASCAFLGAGWRCHDEDAREDHDVKVAVCRGE